MNTITLIFTALLILGAGSAAQADGDETNPIGPPPVYEEGSQPPAYEGGDEARCLACD